MAKEAVEEAISYLGAKSIKSNEYQVALKNTVLQTYYLLLSPSLCRIRSKGYHYKG